jgi:hypothetical protein
MFISGTADVIPSAWKILHHTWHAWTQWRRMWPMLSCQDFRYSRRGLQKNSISWFEQATELKIQWAHLERLTEETGDQDLDNNLQKVSQTKFITQKCRVNLTLKPTPSTINTNIGWNNLSRFPISKITMRITHYLPGLTTKTEIEQKILRKGMLTDNTGWHAKVKRGSCVLLRHDRSKVHDNKSIVFSANILLT